MNMFKPTNAKTPNEYIDMIEEPRRSEIQALHQAIQTAIPNKKPYILSGMIGYGTYHYKYASGREGDWAPVALASQKNYISVYIMASTGERYLAEANAAKFPKASVGKSCIRFKHLADIDLDVLMGLVKQGAGSLLNYKQE
jgi:hypothetical protein